MLEIKAWYENSVILVPVTALASAFFTAFCSEPIKIYNSNRLRKRLLRRIVLMEMMYNLRWLEHGVMACLHFDTEFHNEQFRMLAQSTYVCAAYDNCRRELYLYYQLPEHQWIDSFYASLDRITVEKSDPRFDPDFALRAKAELNHGIEYLKLHPGTWAAIGVDAPSFLQEELNPTIQMQWTRAWRELKTDLSQLRERNEEESN